MYGMHTVLWNVKDQYKCDEAIQGNEYQSQSI